MADDKNFKLLIDEVKTTNKLISNQKEGQKESQEISTELITKSQDKTTENIKKGNEEQAKQAEKQLALDKIAADKQKKLDEAQLAAEKRKEARQKILDRLTKLRKKAPSALLKAGKFATYQNRVMRNLAKGIGKLNRGLGIGAAFKSGGKTIFGVIKKLIQGGLAISGILLLDKFFNSDHWPKFIELLRTKVIPGVKDAITFITGLFTGTLDEMKTDDTAGKFKTSVMSFFKLVGSLFGFGRDTLVDDNDNPIYGKTGKKLQKGYFQQIKDNFTKFKDDFVLFFKSLSRSLAKGLFGYETDEKDFFVGVRNDLKIMFKRIVSAIGEAFYQAFPKIANLFGINSEAENKLLAMEASEPGERLKETMFKTTDEKGGAGVEEMYNSASAKDKKFMIEYAKTLNEYERQRIDNQTLLNPYIPNATNNAFIAGVLGKDAFKDGLGGYDQRLAANANEFFRILMKPIRFLQNNRDEDKQLTSQVQNSLGVMADKSKKRDDALLMSGGEINAIVDGERVKIIGKIVDGVLIRVVKEIKKDVVQSKENNIAVAPTQNNMYNSSHTSTNPIVSGDPLISKLSYGGI